LDRNLLPHFFFYLKTYQCSW